MSEEPLTNTAVEWEQRSHDGLNSIVEMPPDGLASLVDIEATFTDDFTWADHRRIVSHGHGDDPVEFLRSVETAWQSDLPHPARSITEVIAVRGDRTAAFFFRTDYGDYVSDDLSVIHLSADLRRLRRRVQFDVDDRDAAIAEVERLHAETDD